MLQQQYKTNKHSEPCSKSGDIYCTIIIYFETKQGYGYVFKGIPIPKDESDHIEDGTIYRAIALQLEYFYDRNNIKAKQYF